jgi:hypothetical protein
LATISLVRDHRTLRNGDFSVSILEGWGWVVRK